MGLLRAGQLALSRILRWVVRPLEAPARKRDDPLTSWPPVYRLKKAVARAGRRLGFLEMRAKNAPIVAILADAGWLRTDQAQGVRKG